MTETKAEQLAMGWERHALFCEGINRSGGKCRRFIVGELATLGNGHFRHAVFGRTDLRNFGWHCYQHSEGEK